MPILTYAEDNHIDTSHIWEAKINLTLREMFISCYHMEKIFSGYQIISENGVYMWTCTFSVTIN